MIRTEQHPVRESIEGPHGERVPLPVIRHEIDVIVACNGPECRATYTSARRAKETKTANRSIVSV